MAEILMIRSQSGGLYPADEEAEQAFQGWKRGDVLRVKVTKVRNPLFHRKFFAMIDKIYDMGGCDRFDNAESMRKYLIAKAGFFTILSKKDGNYLIESKSISFARMDEVEFDSVYNRVLDAGLLLIGESRRDDVNEAVDAILRFA